VTYDDPAPGGEPLYNPAALSDCSKRLPGTSARAAALSPVFETGPDRRNSHGRSHHHAPLTHSRTRTTTRAKGHGFLVLLLLLSLYLTHLTQAEPVIILDPYFYRTPVSEAIAGSTKTILGYYDETDGKVTPISNPPRLTISELYTLAVAYAQSILKQTSPKFIRDRHGVIVAIRLESQDPAFSSVLLTPGFTDRFADLLGKDCLVCVPNRQTVFLFPRLGGNMEQFAIPLRGIYHNSVWPVSTELFEWQGGGLHSIRDFEPG
jgi:hypothetical protein